MAINLRELLKERVARGIGTGGGLLNTQATGGLLGNLNPLLLGAGIIGSGLQGRDPFSSILPAATQTAQLQQLLTPEEKDRKIVKDVEGRQRYVDTGELVFSDVKTPVKEKDKFRALTIDDFNRLKSQGVNLDPNKGYQINTRTDEIKQIGSGQTINIGGAQKVASAGTPEDKEFLGLNKNDDVTVFKKNNQIVDFKVTSFADQRLKDIAKGVKESKLSDVDSALKDIEDYIKSFEGKNLPGVGLFQGNIPGFATSEAGNELRALIQTYSNIKLQKRSGAAVTPSEFARLQTELVGATKTPDEATFLRILKKNREGLEKQKKQVFAPYREDDLQQYFDSGGLSLYGETVEEQPSITLTPEQLQALPTNILEELLKNLPR